jgi:hypothetical protein
MEQLSSCYFCGDALDSSLDEYPLVPDALAPADGDRRTIVLCPTCKRKLDPVVEVVANAVASADVSPDRSETDDGVVVGENDGDGSEADVDAADDGEDSDASGGTSSIIGDTPSTEDDSFDGETTDEGAEADTSSESDIGSTLGDDEDVLRSVGDDSADEDRRNSDSVADANSDTTTADDSSRSEEPRQRRYTSGQRAGGRPTDQNRSGTDGSGDEGDGDDGSDGSDSNRDITLSRLENTNVMRLLQNREFPVDRDDFVVVASSAYEVSPRHCEKVIDLAVKHDLLHEEDGELQAGANWS